MTLRILIVDDEPAIHEVMASYLTKFLDEFKILAATSGKKAIEEAASCIDSGEPIDFVLMDIKMPDMDGLECTKRLTEMGIKNIHLLTAYFDTESLKQAVEVGAKGVLKKSEGFASVAQKVANIVRGTREPTPTNNPK